jgi:hypothetical protein
MRRRAMALFLASAGCTASDTPSETGQPDPVCTPEAGLELYERRIAPLLADDRPSTCNQCHLSGIELSAYVQATPCETMACMAHQGIVDLEDPGASLVLAWIERAEPSGGITQQTIDSERDAMLEWIEHASACDGELCPPVDEPCGEPPDHTDCEIPPAAYEPPPFDDPGGCSDLTLELVWREKVYTWRGRCFPCHFDSQAGRFVDLDPPPWIVTGDCNPAALAERSGLLDPDEPLRSLLLTKPLEESLGGVEHGGGAKIHSVEEPTYVDFVYFLQRWAECQ